MAAKASIYLTRPSSSGTYTVGEYIPIRLGVENVGNAKGWIQGYIVKDESICKDLQGEVDPGSVVKLYGSECDIYMPNNTVNVTFYARHWDGSKYVQDQSKSITLTPKVKTGSIYVTSSPTGAKVYLDDVYKGTTPKTISNVTAVYHRVKCKKSGYKDAWKDITVVAGQTSNVYITLEEIIEHCYHYFHVKDQNGNNVGSAHVKIGTDDRLTGTNGKVFFYLEKNTSVLVTASKSGYTSDSKNFTVDCSTTTLTLNTSCTCGSWVKGDCISTTHRRYTRTCTPSGCDTEVEVRLDSTCAAPLCSEYTTESSCITAGCYWYNNACHEFSPPVCSDYIDALTCERNLCHWWSDGTCHDTEEGAKDTKITWKPIPTEATINEEITLLIRLTTDELIPLGVNGIPINFYANDTLLNTTPVITTDSPTLGLNGYAELKYTFQAPSGPGNYIIKASYDGSITGYNASTSEERTLTLKEQPPCNQGFRVTVKNVPSSGLRVRLKDPLPLTNDILKSVTPEESTVTFDETDGVLLGTLYNISVITLDNYVLDEKDEQPVPSSGCKLISLNGWNGCKWYTLLTGPSEALLNKSFQIKAVLKEIPLKLVGAGYEVEFYENSITGTPIWTDTTDEHGVAICTVPAKVTEGTYTFFAKYRDAPTYCEPLTGLSVEVKEKIEPVGLWEQLIQFIVDTFDVEPEQAKIIAYAGIGLGAVLLISLLGK